LGEKLGLLKIEWLDLNRLIRYDSYFEGFVEVIVLNSFLQWQVYFKVFFFFFFFLFFVFWKNKSYLSILGNKREEKIVGVKSESNLFDGNSPWILGPALKSITQNLLEPTQVWERPKPYFYFNIGWNDYLKTIPNKIYKLKKKGNLFYVYIDNNIHVENTPQL